MLYFDNNATTPLAEEVIDGISRSLSEMWANPSSNSIEGNRSLTAVETSRQSIATMINAINSREIVFTSGGTEANNWVIMSSIKYFNNQKLIDRKPHIITTNIEHDSIREPLNHLTNDNNIKTSETIDITFVCVSKQTGCVNTDDIIAEIRPETCLITVMMANNETGVIQDIRQLGFRLLKVNKEREKQGLHRILLHSDAAQAIGKIIVDVQDLNVDYMTIVGHKFYGPRIGALYRRTDAPLYPLFLGGGQESGLRAGTENTPMIVGLGLASDLVTKNIDQYNCDFKELQTYFESELKDRFGDLIEINFCDTPSGRLPNTTSLAFVDSRLIGSKILSLVPNLRASLGSACHSTDHKSGIASKILISSGISYYLSLRTIRLSTGRDTTKQDINNAINDLEKVVNQLMSDSSDNQIENLF